MQLSRFITKTLPLALLLILSSVGINRPALAEDSVLSDIIDYLTELEDTVYTGIPGALGFVGDLIGGQVGGSSDPYNPDPDVPDTDLPVISIDYYPEGLPSHEDFCRKDGLCPGDCDPFPTGGQVCHCVPCEREPGGE